MVHIKDAVDTNRHATDLVHTAKEYSSGGTKITNGWLMLYTRMGTYSMAKTSLKATQIHYRLVTALSLVCKNG